MVKISFYQIRILNFQIHSSKVLSIGFPLPDFENMNMKKWMWSEQQRPLRLPLLQFLIQSAQVISFSSYSISNHFSPNLLYSTLLWMQTNRTWKSHRLWNTPHCRSSLIDSTPPCPGPTPTFSLFYFRNLIQFFLNLHSLWICNFYHNSIYSLFYCPYYLF